MSKKAWALVTGASSGIGQATAIELSKAGYNLFLLARRKDRLLSLQKELKTDSKVIVVDINRQDQLQDFIQAEKKTLQHLEVLVNNAGLAKGVEKMQDAKLEDWDLMIETNIKALLSVTRSLLPFLLENKKGHIVNIGSVAGRWVYPGGGVYCATKYAVRALSEGLRMDLMGTGLRVTNVEPGMVNTEFSLVRLENADKANAVYAGMTPLSAQDIADTVVWCVQRPQHVNIQEVVVFPTDQAAVGPYVHRRS